MLLYVIKYTYRSPYSITLEPPLSQNNYTFAQPGIQENVNSLKKLVDRIDGRLFRSTSLFTDECN